MLNELYQLSKNLQKSGIVFGSPNQDIKKPGKGDGFIIGINGEGQPESIEYVDSVNMTKLWTIRKGKHNSFPYMKIKPLWELPLHDELRDALKELRKKKSTKKNHIDQLETICNSKKINDQKVIIPEWTKKKLINLSGKDDNVGALICLLERMPGKFDKSNKFMKTLANLFLQNRQTIINDGYGISDKNGKKRQEIYETVLLGRKKKEKGKEKVVCDVPLFFDVSDWQNFPCRVAHPDMGKLVEAHLPSSQQGNEIKGVSALEGGFPKQMHTGPYPDPTLPSVGIAYLFSMNKDIPCHHRYRLTGSDIFPLSKDAVDAAYGALLWCTSDERRGKTWQGIPNMKRKQDLLISYLDEKPENAIELASVFAAFDVDKGEIAESAFESKAKTVCTALKGEEGLTDNSQVNVIVINKVDEGRAQVALSDSYTIKNILQSLEEWRVASDNRPPFSLLLPGMKGEKALKVLPSSPSPIDIMKCLQNQWIKNGIDKRNVPGVYLRNVYDLYLGSSFIVKQAANNFINLSLQRLGELLIGYAGADHSNNIMKFSLEARKTVLNGMSILAIALYKLDIKKEDYMKNAAFSVGRMLALADKLHCEFCIHERGKNMSEEESRKSIPPQLIGNAHMRTALDNPLKGLSLISERLLIYQAWATKAQGENVGLAKWVLRQLGQVSADLENADIPKQTDDAVKAQVLLGYLAHVKNES